jgi:hypothetical protein
LSPTTCFLHRLDAEVPREGTLVPSFLYSIVPSLESMFWVNARLSSSFFITLKLSLRKKNSPYYSGLFIFFYILHSFYTTEHILWLTKLHIFIIYYIYFLLKVCLGSMCTAVLIGWDPAIPPPPHLGSFTRSAKIDDISLWPPAVEFLHPYLHPFSQ